ncbi:helix-turn-helix transcriptional regulator [Virgibacillus salexigens]|uniref:helix-turn-helix transcriptional regulator n=1 Tax=Virgibacillus salexigens TaxID=61016 RepID=UPI00190D6E96|nr:helix-turn-helix transcriptional regulator [Virgibacillus salexigens]
MKSLIGERIQASGLKQRYIAKEIGVNENTVRNWMNGNSFPRLNQAVKLADILKCEITDLYIKEANNND